MQNHPDQLVQQIHDSPWKAVLAITGGGCRAVNELLEVPGASRTLIEAVVPYSPQALTQWVGGRVDEHCSSRTARAMAMRAYLRGLACNPNGTPTAGVSCTAALTTDRPKRGPHRIFVAAQTNSTTSVQHLELLKDRRSRVEEERIAANMILNAVAETCGIAGRWPLELLEGEVVAAERIEASRDRQELLLGRVEFISNKSGQPTPSALFSGAFNPIHVGHRRIAQIASEILQKPIAWEMSVLNVEKPPMDFMEIERRLKQFDDETTVLLTRAATFEEKSRLFPGATFIVGADTIRRIGMASYYACDENACRCALERIAHRGCRFLVFGRDLGTGFMRLPDLEIPEALRAICTEVPPEKFREDISSTLLRREAGR